MCIDPDQDGHGFQCAAGEDCDESDPNVFEGCMACNKPAEGCACEPDAVPIDCELPKLLTSSGGLLCRTGTRYCRDGVWSECEGIKSFEAPPPSRFLANALIDSGAAETCGPCSPDCYQLNDPLNTGDSSSVGPNVVAGDGGGITLGMYTLDGGYAWDGDTGVLNEVDCTPGGYPDFECDGIPDEFDPYPTTPPFASNHETIFMDLAPGDQQSKTFEIEFYVNTVDIYLYLDMTGSMGGELTNLIASLNTNNYMPASWTGPCRDRNRNGDTSDEEYLKNEGVTGNIACMIRDSSFGTGWHRDIPFPIPDSQGYAYGPHDFEAFQHEQDITDDVELVLAALNRFHTRGGINRPEGGIMGLYALATGSQLYMGWNRPGNPAPACADATAWGYPCFRQDAVPIVVWMTDAPVTNGPATVEGHLGPDFEAINYAPTRNQLIDWPASSLGIETASDSTYHPVSGNETFANATPLGSVHDSFKTYTGSTRLMDSNITYQEIGGACTSGGAWSLSAQAAPDAVFALSITQSEPITISTRGSRFDTALAIVPVSRVGSSVTTLTSAPAATTTTSPHSLGTGPLTIGQPLQLSGAAPTSTAVFTRDAVGCLDGDNGSSDKVSASVLKFNLASDAAALRVATDATSGVASALFAGQPRTPADTSLGSISVAYGTGTRSGNSNDYFGGYNAGNLTGQYRRFTNGSTADSDLSIPNFDASMFQTQPACAGVSGTSRDAVIDFSLSATTTLRIEGTGNNDTLQAGFDHVIALVRRTSTTHAAVTGNTTDATARVIPPAELVDDGYTWTQYIGVLGGSTSTYLQSEVGPFQSSYSGNECTNGAPNNGGSQAVYSLTPTVTGVYDFNTVGSGFTTWLSVHEDIADTQRTVTSSNLNDSTSGQSLGAVDEISTFVTGGSLATHGTATSAYVNMSAFGCATSGTGGRDAIYRFTVAADQVVSVTVGDDTGTAQSPGLPAFNSNVAIFRGSITAANRIAGDCTDQSGNGSTVTDVAVAPGNTYYVVVKSLTTGSLNSTTGDYGLWLRDTTFSSHVLGCDTGSEVNAASITRTLTAGRTYYILVKGGSTTAGYQLNARRAPASEPAILACDRQSGGTNHSVIQQTLPAGNYSVIIRGYGTGTGSYNLIMRDVGVAPVALSCQYDDNANPSAPLTVTNLAARDASNNLIDYYLVVRGNTTASAYTLQIEDGSTPGVECAHDNVTMQYSQASPAYTRTDDINNAEWTGTLPLGDYYVVLKGYDQTNASGTSEDDDSGMYQLSVGDQVNHEGAGSFDAKRWLGPANDGVGGVLEALQAKNVHVITVDSTTGSGDDSTYSDQQLRTISSATGAVDTDGNALFFPIASDGTGLGAAIVQAVFDLSETLAMDVGVQLVEEPQSPAPKHFGFLVRAIDQADDGCDGPPQDRDNDGAGIVDTHVECLPSATPRFEISFSNPTPPNHVEPNPDDPLGGWTMKLRLIGRDGTLNDDGTPKTYYLDEIPVYIIPEDLVAQPGEDRFNTTGTYEQTVSSARCFDGESPLWRSLSWEGDLPSGTALTWKVCTADTEAELASCTLQTAATFRSGIDCTADSQCPTGYCEQVTSRCEFATGPACSSDSECGVNGSCVSGACAWSQKPIDVKPALARGMQGKAFARVQVTLTSNASQTRAPSITSWYLRYTCTAQE